MEFAKTALKEQRYKIGILDSLDEATIDDILKTEKVKGFISSRLENPTNKILEVGDDKYLEFFTDNNDVVYFNLKNSISVSKSEIVANIEKGGFLVIDSSDQINLAEKQIFNDSIPSDRLRYFGKSE